MSFVSHAAKIVFTGDALLIRGCGRTDFQQGNSESLFNSIHTKILALPDEYSVFPGHDYNGFYIYSFITPPNSVFIGQFLLFLIIKNRTNIDEHWRGKEI
jgi:glyoxylase-like metal-dependent hydrolase (beta-lactamase superfamily II)